MEDQKTVKQNTVVDLPRDPEGKLIIEQIATGKDEKNNYIVPDDIFNSYYKELPAGTINRSGTWRAANNGKIKIFGGDPEADKEIHRKGAATSNAAQAQRRTFKDTIDYMLRQKAKKTAIEELELKEDATNLDMIIASALKQAERGNTKAYEFLRDTVGEKPATEVNATIEEITPEDKELLQRVNARLNSNT